MGRTLEEIAREAAHTVARRIGLGEQGFRVASGVILSALREAHPPAVPQGVEPVAWEYIGDGYTTASITKQPPLPHEKKNWSPLYDSRALEAAVLAEREAVHGHYAGFRCLIDVDRDAVEIMQKTGCLCPSCYAKLWVKERAGK